ncbi:hypothetical protein CERSUDRAFT_61297, partial [Gelatoporia subvermispora B]
ETGETAKLPLTHSELYKKIDGLILVVYAGTGRTLLPKRVRIIPRHLSIGLVRSEFVQKYLGKLSRAVHDNAPDIICINKIDTTPAERFDAQTGTDCEALEY